MEKLKIKIDKMVIVLCITFMLILILSVFWQVFSRYILQNPSQITDELARFAMIWFGFFAICYGFSAKGHLYLDFLLNKTQGRRKSILEIFIYILCLLFIGVVLLKGGFSLTINTMEQYSPVLQIPMGLVYLVLPLTGVLNSYYFCFYILVSIRKYKASN